MSLFKTDEKVRLKNNFWLISDQTLRNTPDYKRVHAGRTGIIKLVRANYNPIIYDIDFSDSGCGTDHYSELWLEKAGKLSIPSLDEFLS